MRFIIHELPYERPISAGRLRYERDGVPTGAVESWRLTNAVDGFRFLRVDLDAREAPSGRSYLYHLTLNSVGNPEQLKFRLWGDGMEIRGSAVWEADGVIGTRYVNEIAYEDAASGRVFWFPSGIGLAQLALHAGVTRGVTQVTGTADPARLMALVETPVVIVWDGTAMEKIDGEILPVRPLHVTWSDQRRTVWLDPHGRPLRLWRDDGLTAVAERLVRYD